MRKCISSEPIPELVMTSIKEYANTETVVEVVREFRTSKKLNHQIFK